MIDHGKKVNIQPKIAEIRDRISEDGMKVSFPVYGKSPIQEVTDALIKERAISKLGAMDLRPDEIGYNCVWKNGEFKMMPVKADDFYKKAEEQMETAIRHEGVMRGTEDIVNPEGKHWVVARPMSLGEGRAFGSRDKAIECALERVEAVGGKLVILEAIGIVEAKGKLESFKSK